jgi:dTMP kinase
VVCDRYTDSTLAYQGYARGLDLKTIRTLNRIATSGIMPGLTILLNLSTRVGLSKALGRSAGGGDRLEMEGQAFQREVQKGFLALAQREKRRIKVVNVQKTIEATQTMIRRIVEKHGPHRT